MIRIELEKRLESPGHRLHIDLDLHVPDNGTLAIYGNSGAGKTSLLRMIAGLLEADKGTIVINGEVWFKSNEGINKAPNHRNIGFMFQDYSLFPNMTVRQNLEYALQKGQDPQMVEELLDITQLERLSDRRPGSLSGGQQQRTALARALVRKPDLLLLDEPLSALDHDMRRSLQDFLLKAKQRYGFMMIIVTHDIGEIFRIADIVAIMEEGKVTRMGEPHTVFTGPTSGGKFRFHGEIVDIAHEDVIYVLSVLIGNTITKVVADVSEVNDLKVGDRVMVSSKAFNPMIQKIS